MKGNPLPKTWWDWRRGFRGPVDMEDYRCPGCGQVGPVVHDDSGSRPPEDEGPGQWTCYYVCVCDARWWARFDTTSNGPAAAGWRD